MQPWVTAAHGSVSDIIDSVVFLYLAGQIICFRFFGFFTGNLSADVAAMTKDFGSYPGNRSVTTPCYDQTGSGKELFRSTGDFEVVS